MTGGPRIPEAPRNLVVVLMDSLNRHMLGCYGGREFDTPNLDRFARRAVRFDRHYAGSLPCIPARHDLLCGALDFLWKPWGSIELWEAPVTAALRAEGVVSMLISGFVALAFARRFGASRRVTGNPEDAPADPTAVRRHRLAGRIAVGASVMGFLTACGILAGMISRAG